MKAFEVMRPIILTLSTLFAVYGPGVNCGLLSSMSEKVLMPVLKRTLPFDPEIGLSIYKSFREISEKFAKIKNYSRLSHVGIFAVERLFTKSLDGRDIQFYSYDQEKKTREPSSLKNISEEIEKLFFVVHGWGEDVNDSKWYMDMALKLTDNFPRSQVILVDWGSSSNLIYPFAAQRTKAVGQYIAKELIELVKNKAIILETIVLIGYDLGAHVCGAAGQSFLTATKNQLPLIIGLDPSGPKFQAKDKSKRLDETDARVVIAVHTDTALFGYKGDCGTIDFYPNGGGPQPGCSRHLFCNHRRSYELFISAISSPNRFSSLQCDNDEQYQQKKCKDNGVKFGDISVTETGKYYFDTTGASPFYKSYSFNPFRFG